MPWKIALPDTSENMTGNEAGGAKTESIRETSSQFLNQKYSEGPNAQKKKPFSKAKFENGGAVENNFQNFGEKHDAK